MRPTSGRDKGRRAYAKLLAGASTRRGIQREASRSSSKRFASSTRSSRCRLRTSARCSPRAAFRRWPRWRGSRSPCWARARRRWRRTAILDREIDARNPRTARRALASGALSPAAMLWAIGAGLASLLVGRRGCSIRSASSCCRSRRCCCCTIRSASASRGSRTSCSAPSTRSRRSARTSASRERSRWPALLLFAGGHGLGRGIRHHLRADGPVASIATRASVRCRRASAKRAAACCRSSLHVVDAAAARRRGRRSRSRPAPTFCGVVSAAALMLYEEHLFRSGANLFVINERVFISNMTFSVFFLLHDRRRLSCEAARLHRGRGAAAASGRGAGARADRPGQPIPLPAAVSAAADDRA